VVILLTSENTASAYSVHLYNIFGLVHDYLELTNLLFALSRTILGAFLHCQL